MTRRRPPARLPKGFVEIWRALSEAEAGARSRRQLASRLGVSTETLQRILVRGDVPELATLENPRIVHAWTRTITRLADACGRDPRRWVEQVGIAWTDAIARVSNAALERRRSRWRQPGAEAPPGWREAATATSIWGVDAAHSPLRIGVVRREAFRALLPSYGATIFEVLARRLAKAIDPDAEVELVSAAERDIVAELRAASERMPFAVGVRAAVHRLRWGLEFVSIPGFGTRLGALWCGPEHERRGAQCWDRVVGADSEADHTFVVVDDVAAAYLRGQCGVRHDRVVESSAANSEELGAALAHEVRRRGSLALVADEELCARTEAVLEAAGDGALRTTLITGCEQSPHYPLSVAVPSRNPRMRRLIEEAIAGELFGSSRSKTMELIAEHVAFASLQTTQSPRRAWQLEEFDRWPGVREELARSLLLAMERALDLGPPTSEGRPHARAFQHALTLVPAAWRSTLAWSAGRTETRAGSERRRRSAEVATRPHLTGTPASTNDLVSHHCRSCSVSLGDASNRGVSDRYCRYCADEGG